MITEAQKRALEKVAQAFGCDKMSDDKLFAIVWSVFHYWVKFCGARTGVTGKKVKGTFAVQPWTRDRRAAMLARRASPETSGKTEG